MVPTLQDIFQHKIIGDMFAMVSLNSGNLFRDLTLIPIMDCMNSHNCVFGKQKKIK